jgi:hypothetical protein
MTHEMRWRSLVAALATVVPESRDWARVPPTESSDDGLAGEGWLEVASSTRPGEQSLIVRLRSDGDLQVEYHVATRRGSPFEALFVVPPGEESAVSAAVARFVADLVNERLVLAYVRELVGGGRQFLTAEQVALVPTRRLGWATSWRGSHDRGS